MQRHQHGIDRNTRKGTFARNALFLGGLGDRGGRHAEKAERSIVVIVPASNRSRREARGKTFLKSVAYLNEKHSRSSYLKHMRQQPGAPHDKTAP
ncbi:hypothetical protein [Paraburkholderia atlantica]|uniref:hypothetical protein n=1 Tax=Paraburkholderia atlantica TaxID=2654982 RepID=UPI00187B6FBB|nr:hypothetical protein [Paraburkholderia atlantica]